VTFGGRKISGNMAQAQLIWETNPFFFLLTANVATGKCNKSGTEPEKKEGNESSHEHGKG
jgi:hypothetical protein